MQEKNFEKNIRAKVGNFIPDADIPDFGLIEGSIPVFDCKRNVPGVAGNPPDSETGVRKIFMFPFWLGAAAVIALMFAAGYFLSYNEDIIPKPAKTVSSHIIPDHISSEINDIIIPENDLFVYDNRVAEKYQETINVSGSKEEENNEDIEIMKDEVTPDVPTKRYSAVASSKNNQLSLNEENSYFSVRRENKKNKGSRLSVGLLASNNLNGSGSTGISDAGTYVRFDNAAEEVYALSPNDAFGEFRHKLPIRAGLSFGYYLSKRLMVETGMIYSFLQSEFSLNSGVGEKGEQKLQYIGIPLSLSYDLLNSCNLRLYLGAGGEVNFNISAAQKYNIGDIPVKHTGTDNKPVWSYRIKAGVSYNIIGNTELYVEPSVARFFSDSEMNTVWKDNKYTFDLNLGLRLKF